MHFDNVRLARVETRQGIHRIVERGETGSPAAPRHRSLFQRDMRRAAAAFQVVAPGALHQNAAINWAETATKWARSCHCMRL